MNHDPDLNFYAGILAGMSIAGGIGIMVNLL